MIEIFKSRRYIGLCIILVIVCIIVMIFEGLFTSDKHSMLHEHNVMEHPPTAVPPESRPSAPSTNNDTKKPVSACWMHEEYHIVARCSHCSELAMKGNFTACQKTGFVEQVRCKSGAKVVRSCVHELAVASFYKFELVMILISIAGWFLTQRREAFLTKVAMDRINKQLSCGV